MHKLFYLLIITLLLLPSKSKINTLEIKNIQNLQASNSQILIPPINLTSDFTCSVWINVQYLSHTSQLIFFNIKNQSSNQIGIPLSNIRNNLNNLAISQLPTQASCTSKTINLKDWALITFSVQYQADSTKSTKLFINDVEQCSQDFTITNNNALMHLYELTNVSITQMYLHKLRIYENRPANLPNLSTIDTYQTAYYYKLDSLLQNSLPSAKFNSTIIIPPSQTSPHSIISVYGPKQQGNTTQKPLQSTFASQQKSLYLDPSNRAELKSAFPLRYNSQIMTLQVWAYSLGVTTAGSSSYFTRFGFLIQVQGFFGIAINTNNQLSCIEQGGFNPPMHQFTGFTVPLRQWKHLTCVLQNTSVWAYIDGTIERTTGTVQANTNFNRKFIIGTDGSDGAYFGGYLRDARVWAKHKTGGEILRDMKRSFIGAENTSLIGYFPLNQQSGTEIFDHSSHQIILASSNRDVTLEASSNFAWGVLNQSITHCPAHYTPFITPTTQQCLQQNSIRSKYIKFNTITSNAAYIKSPIQVNSFSFTTQPATFQTWIQPQTVETAEQFIFQLDSTVSLSLIQDGAALKIDRHSQSQSAYTQFGRSWTRPMGRDGVTPDSLAINSQAIITREWTHIATTFEITGTTLSAQIYKNGVSILAQTTVIAEGINMNGGELIFGSRTGGMESQMFVGFLAHFRMWRELRTQQNIQEFMHRVLSDPTHNLIAYYYFDSHHQGRTIIDNSRYLGNIAAVPATQFFQSEPSKVLIICDGTTWFDGKQCRDDNWTILRQKPLHNGATPIQFTPSLNMPSTAIQQISISVWLFIHASRTNQKIFIDDTTGAKTATAIEISLTAQGKLYTSLCAKNLQEGAVNFSSTTNSWQHVARTASAQSNTLIIRGVKDNAANDLGGTFACPANSITFQIFPADSEYLMAKQFSMYDKLLTLSDIKRLSNGMNPSKFQPLHYLKLSDASRQISDSIEYKNFFVGLDTLNKHNMWMADANTLRVCLIQDQVVRGTTCAKDTGHFFSSLVVTDVSNIGASTQTFINGLLASKVFTLNIWMKITGSLHAQVTQSIFTVISQSAAQFELKFTNLVSIQNSQGAIVKGIRVISCNEICSNWVFFSLTQNLSSFKIYFNGFEFQTMTAATQPTYSSTSPVNLRLSSDTQPFVGGIKSVTWIASQVLSQTDLLSSMLNQKLPTRNYLTMLFEQSTSLTYIHQDSGQQLQQTVTTGTWAPFETTFNELEVSAKLQNTSEITIPLPQPTTASSNCAFSLVMIYTFESYNDSTIVKLTTNSGAKSIISFTLTPSLLNLSLNIDRQQNREFHFISDVNAENTLIIGRFGSSNQFHIIVNGRSVQKLLLQNCDTANDFHKDRAQLRIQKGMVLSSLSYFKASKRSSQSLSKLLHQKNWRQKLVNSLQHDLLITLNPYSSDFVNSSSQHHCFLLLITPPSSQVSTTPTSPFPCFKKSPISLPQCNEEYIWNGQKCIKNQNKTILIQKGTFSPIRLPVFIQSEQSQPIDLTIQFWIFSGIKPNFASSPSARTLLQIPDYSTYKLNIQRNSSTSLQQLASISNIATHAVSYNLPVNQWQNLAVTLSSLNEVSLFSNSFRIMNRKANNLMTRNKIQSIYLCGNDSDSSQMLERCSVMQIMLWNGVKGESQLRRAMYHKLSVDQISLTFAYYSLRNWQNPYTLYEQRSGNQITITMPHNPTTHTDYTQQPLYLSQLQTGISSIRICNKQSNHIYGLNQCNSAQTSTTYPHITANKIGLAVSIPQTNSSTGQWTLQFWLKVINQSTIIGSFPIITQTVQNSPFGLQIQSTMSTINKITFIPQLTDQQQLVQLQTELIQLGAWGQVVCRNTGLQFEGIYNLGRGSISGNYTIFNNPGSQLRFGMTGLSNIDRGGEFSVGGLVIWSSVRDDSQLKTWKFKSISQIKGLSDMVMGYDFKNGDLINGKNELESAWFMKSESFDDGDDYSQWVVLDKIGYAQREKMTQSQSTKGSKVPIIQAKTYKLPLNSPDMNKFSRSLLRRGFNLEIWVRVQNAKGGGNFISLDDFLSIGLEPLTFKYNSKFYYKKIISSTALTQTDTIDQWKKLSLLYKGDSIKKLSFYINQQLGSNEISITTAEKSFIKSPNNYLLLGDNNNNIVFRLKYLKLFTDYLGSTPIMKNIKNSIDLHNHWLLDQQTNQLYDAQNNQKDEFSRKFSISDLPEIYFTDDAVVFDPELYFCQNEEHYEPILSQQTSHFCLNRKRNLKIASGGPDLVFLNALTTASLTNFTFQASYFISGGALANDGTTTYKLTTLFGNTDLEISVNSANFDTTTGWHHITLLYQHSIKTKKMYIDTAAVTSLIISSITPPITSPQIAIHSLTSPLYFYIRQLRLFSSLLTDSGVKYDTLNTKLRLRKYDLVAYYPLLPHLYNEQGSYTLQDLVAQHQLALPKEHTFQPITDAQALLDQPPCEVGQYRVNSKCLRRN